MRTLVTGGAGFIGTNFIRYWLEHHPGDTIINFDKLTYAGDRDNLVDLEENDSYQFIAGDICCQDEVEAVMAEVDQVVNFAAESHVDRSIANPQVFLETNVLGTHNLLEAAVEHDIQHFHHVSTDEVYGALALDSEEKFHEQRRYDPRSPYSASKAASDHLVRAYWHTFKLPITITNCSNNYGPYQYPEKFMPRMITNMLDGKKIPIYGDGKYVRDWLYVEDHCRAIEAVLTNGEIGETYCVGGQKEDVSNLALAKKVLQVMEKDEEEWLTFVTDRAGHDRRYAVDWSKIQEELGWEPQHSLEEGIAATVEWYRDNEDWWRTKKEEAEAFYNRQGK